VATYRPLIGTVMRLAVTVQSERLKQVVTLSASECFAPTNPIRIRTLRSSPRVSRRVRRLRSISVALSSTTTTDNNNYDNGRLAATICKISCLYITPPHSSFAIIF
jgi:hypothetical protein